MILWYSESAKGNSLFNLISQEPGIDKIYLYTKNLFEAKHQFLINKIESTGLKHFNDSKGFIECCNDTNNIYRNVQEYSPNNKGRILIVFDDMIADILSNKKLNPIITELFSRGRKLNNSCFYYTIWFCCTKTHSANN